MENAAEALRMAGGVLIFVLALTISINAFSQSRQGIDNLVLYSDREFLSTYVEQNEGTKRIVGAESMVPTIYRAYKENIKINFAFLSKDENGYLYKKLAYGGSVDSYVTYIDLETEAQGDEGLKEYYLRRILFGTDDNVKNLYMNENRISDYNNCKDNISKRLVFNDDGLYYRLTSSTGLSGKTYEESLGVYFKGEENGVRKHEKSSINKTEKKVITYRIKND